jgi:hypothetical protein
MLSIVFEYQSQEINSALLQPVWQQVDAEGLPYLEVATADVTL